MDTRLLRKDCSRGDYLRTRFFEFANRIFRPNGDRDAEMAEKNSGVACPDSG